MGAAINVECAVGGKTVGASISGEQAMYCSFEERRDEKEQFIAAEMVR